MSERGVVFEPHVDLEKVEALWGQPPWEIEIAGFFPQEVMEHVVAVNMDGVRFERIITCHAVDKFGKAYEPSPQRDLIDAVCGRCGNYLGGQDSDYAGTRCGRCGALVTRAEPCR